MSDTIAVDASLYWRQLDIIDPQKLGAIDVTMIGVGGLGSPTAMALAKMGIKNFTIYDHDVVDEHNVPNQMYTLHDIGKPKVDAISNVISSMGGDADGRQEKFESQVLNGIVIVTVDNMEGRRAVWDSIKWSPSIPLLIDARMGAEVGRIFAVNPADLDDIRYYENTLYSDEEAVELPCTAQSIIYNTFSVAALVSRLVKGFASSEALPKELIIDSVQFAIYKLG